MVHMYSRKGGLISLKSKYLVYTNFWKEHFDGHIITIVDCQMYTHAYYFAHIFLTFKVVFSPDPQSSGKEVLHKCKWSHNICRNKSFPCKPRNFPQIQTFEPTWMARRKLWTP